MNQNGLTARKIIRDTNDLKNTKIFWLWTRIWWVLLGSAGIILFDQLLGAIIGICTKLNICL